MSEFANRIEAQRAILKTVNKLAWDEESLHSLTKKSLDRWVLKNQLKPDSPIYKLLLEAAENLFFLANKSQEQITEDYLDLSAKVSHIHDKISQEIERIRETS